MEDIKRDSLSEEKAAEEGRPFFPNHFLKEVIGAYLVIGILLSLAILFPFSLHERADPFKTPEGIKPEWYLLFAYQFLKFVPKIVGLTFMGLSAILLFLIPFLDKSPYRHPKKRKLATFLGVAVLFLALVLGIFGFLSESTRSIFGKKYHFDLKGIPHQTTEETKEK